MKARSLLLLLAVVSIVGRAVAQSVPKYIVGPGEYNCLILNTSTNQVFSTTSGVPTLVSGLPSTIKTVMCGAHHWLVVDGGGNVWCWGTNPNGECGVGYTSATVDVPTQVTTDVNGNPFNNVIQVCGGGPAAGTGWASAALKADGTVWVWGNTVTGMRGNGTDGGNDTRPVQVTFPAGVVIKKIQFYYIGIALDQNGNVWTWGGGGTYQSPWTLGQGSSNPDYNTPHMLKLPSPAKDIAGGYLWNYALLSNGQLWGWGFYYPYLGIGTGGMAGNGNQQLFPVQLDAELNLPKPVSKIATNNNATYVILTDGTLWAWGDAACGALGNGQEINWATYKTPYNWDWGLGELLVQKPVQIAAGLNNFTDIFTSSSLCFYAYVEDGSGNLYAMGRNKGSVIANGVKESDGIVGALGGNYPNSWDVPYITKVDPFSYKTPIMSPSPYCYTSPGAIGCSTSTNAPPNVSAGPTQNINTTSTTLQGTASGNGGATPVYTIWTQVSGPNTALITIPSGLTATASGLVTGTYVFKLTVTDNEWKVNTSTVTVNVNVNSTSTPPTVNAGSAQTITLPTSTTTLKGTATGNNGATIASTTWSEVSGPSTASIGSASNLSTAVSGLVAGTYVFQLSAKDNNGLTATSTVTVTVNAATSAAPPTVSAGSNVTITLPTSTALLSGSASGNGGATITSTVWSQVSGPSTASLASASSLNASAYGLVAGTYTFKLTATDNTGQTASATVTVTVNGATVTPVAPTVNAGSNVTITLPTNTATLAGSATGNNGATITSTVWSQVSGPSTASLASPTTLNASAYGLVAGTYTFKLTATDNNGQTASANMTVTVNAAAVVPPTVSAGSNVTITLPTSTALLNGTASGNGGATISSTVWSQVSGPSTASLASPTSLNASAYGLVAGTYTFKLTATDNNGQTASANVTVTVNAATAAPVPPIVSAGSNITVQLPTSSATLTGTASGNGGSTITGTTWSQQSGPNTATIGSASSLSTTISGLVAGTYVFQLRATDNNNLTTTSTVEVYVKAANVAPTVSAGSNVTITLPTNTALLSGTATGNGGATIASTVWTQSSGPNTASIGSATSLNASAYGLVAGTYTFTLTATDNNGLSAKSTMTVTVNPATKTPPSVNAGNGKKVKQPTSSTSLSGTATGTGGANIVSTSWTQVSGPTTATITGGTTLTPTVSGMTTTGSYVFQLTGTDNNGLSATSNTTVEVDAADVAPTVSAGSDITVQLPTSSAELKGVATGNGGATIVSVTWSEVSGPVTANISSAQMNNTIVNGLTKAGDYVFQLVATDNNGQTGTSQVTVHVLAAPANQPPVANAGPDQTISLPTSSATLDGTKSYDPDGTIATYSWYQLSGKGGVTIANSNTATPKVSGLQEGQYTFVLLVTDNSGATAQDEVTITVNAQSATTTPSHLVANAGKDTTVAPPASLVVLNGSASSDSGATITSYRWTLVSGSTGVVLTTPNAAVTSVIGLTTGTYVFQLTVKDDQGDSSSANVKVSVVNNQRQSATDRIFIYPNPAHDIANLQINSHVSGTAVMKIHSLRGNVVREQEITLQEGLTTIQVNVSGLASGVYFVNIIAGNAVLRGTIIKQ